MSAPDRPTLVNRNAIRADTAAIRMSQAAAITAPAPAVVPFNAAITGRRHCRIASTRSHVIRVHSSSSRYSRPIRRPMMSRTSPPEQNAFPVPVITTARTPGSVLNARNV